MTSAVAGERAKISSPSVTSASSRRTFANPTIADITLDALLDRAARTIGVERGSGLRSYLEELSDAVDGWARPGLRSIATFAQSDARFAERFRTEFLGERHGALTAQLESELGDRARADQLAELIAGSMWYRILVVDRPLDAAWIAEMAALVGDRADAGS